MKREQKYPNTKTFMYYNANPKNRVTTDCVTRAICTALELPYNQVVMEMAEMWCKTGIHPGGKKGIDTYLKSKGWIRMPQPRKFDNTKFTGKELCEDIQEYPFNYPGRMVANIGGQHIVAIVEGRVLDTWNSTGKCIGNYWIPREFI